MASTSYRTRVIVKEHTEKQADFAGTYNLLQPKIANELKSRKVGTLMATRPDVISAGNIGCMMQIGSAARLPVVHTIQLLDWAYGGPKPAALDNPNPINRRA